MCRICISQRDSIERNPLVPSCCKRRQKRGCKLDGDVKFQVDEFKVFGKYAESAGLQSIICHILNIFIDDQVGILQIV